MLCPVDAPLPKEINRIKSEIADLGAEIMWGKTCNELVKEIIEKATNCRLSPQIDT